MKHITSVRVRYSESDQMRMAYYSRYLEYFEVARTEYMKDKGVSYRSLEEEGYYLPVLEAHIQYIRSARYDDELIIESTFDLRSIPVIRIDYIVMRDSDLIAKGYTTHTFVNATSGKPCKPPQRFFESFKTGQ